MELSGPITQNIKGYSNPFEERADVPGNISGYLQQIQIWPIGKATYSIFGQKAI